MSNRPYTLIPEAAGTVAGGSEPGNRLIQNPESMGALVRERRHALELTQAEVADYAGVGRRFVSELEEGKPTIQLDKAFKVLGALGIKLIATE